LNEFSSAADISTGQDHTPKQELLILGRGLIFSPLSQNFEYIRVETGKASRKISSGSD
jgi:hypothetical protein